MGLRILTVTVGALTLVGIVDFFSGWYGRFLSQRPISESLRIILRRILWVVFALTFWMALLHFGLPEQFDTTHFLFVLFIYSIRGMIVSFVISNDKNA
jgi:hypothetical protein